MMKRKKNTESIANPLAVRVWHILANFKRANRRTREPYNHTVIPGKYSQLIQPRNQVPASSDIPSNKYSKGEHREGVHELEPSTVLSTGGSAKMSVSQSDSGEKL